MIATASVCLSAPSFYSCISHCLCPHTSIHTSKPRLTMSYKPALHNAVSPYLVVAPGAAKKVGEGGK